MPQKGQLLIQNYGLLWDRCRVKWVGGGSLYGRPIHPNKQPKMRSPHVDFREQSGVYALYDTEFRLLYVGQAGDGKTTCLFARLKAHHAERPIGVRWRYFSWFGLRYVKADRSLSEPSESKLTSPSAILDGLEAILIEVAEPPLNRQGGKLGVAEAYSQVTEDASVDGSGGKGLRVRS